jgi:hypothetical protein
MRAAHVRGGIAGWLVGALPLVGVNVAGFLGLFSFQDTLVAGGIALLGGILLGGIAAGSIAGRARAALASGGIAALLFVFTIVALEVVTAVTDVAPPLVAAGENVQDAIRAVAVLVFAAALLLAVSLVTGTIRNAPDRDGARSRSSRQSDDRRSRPARRESHPRASQVAPPAPDTRWQDGPVTRAGMASGPRQPQPSAAYRAARGSGPTDRRGTTRHGEYSRYDEGGYDDGYGARPPRRDRSGW